MSIKGKIINKLAAHPKLTTLGIGLAITFVVGLAIGAVDNIVVFAKMPPPCPHYNDMC